MHERRDEGSDADDDSGSTKTALSGFCVCGRYGCGKKSLNYTVLLLHEAMNTLALSANGITKRQEESLGSLVNKFLIQEEKNENFDTAFLNHAGAKLSVFPCYCF